MIHRFTLATLAKLALPAELAALALLPAPAAAAQDVPGDPPAPREEPAAGGQDGSGPERPPLGEAPPATRAADPFPYVLPGALPETTTPEAEAAWLALCDATLAEGAERRRIEAFDIVFDVTTRNGVQTNDGVVRHRFLAPSFVRTRLESGREQGRGPGGYWGRDEKERAERRVVRYEGREYAEDRWSIDQALAISRNFVALADPASLRLLRLVRLGEAPLDEVPASLRAEAQRLEWVELLSPDFGLPSREPTTREVKLYRVRIGSAQDTHQPVLVSVQEELASARLRALPLEAEGGYDGYLIELREPRAVDGFMLPSQIFHYPYRVTKASGSTVPRTAFPPKPEQEFYPHLSAGMLSPGLTPESFRPE